MKELRDSKMLDGADRERLAKAVRAEAVSWSIAWSTVREINAWGISKANYTAMVRAISSLDVPPEHLLIDGPITVDHPLPQTAIIDGDAYCTSIAAASIIAKVARDTLMCELDYFFPNYGFAIHKGYATRDHLERIERYGVCSQHRDSWLAVQRRAAVFTSLEEAEAAEDEPPSFLTVGAEVPPILIAAAHNGVMDSMGTAQLV
jgi:ribonuclease HII